MSLLTLKYLLDWLQGFSSRRNTLRRPAHGRAPAGAVPTHSRCFALKPFPLICKWQTFWL